MVKVSADNTINSQATKYIALHILRIFKLFDFTLNSILSVIAIIKDSDFSIFSKYVVYLEIILAFA
jgi:hypothetical protein